MVITECDGTFELVMLFYPSVLLHYLPGLRTPSISIRKRSIEDSFSTALKGSPRSEIDAHLDEIDGAMDPRSHESVSSLSQFT
jgi:hypothetical protein